MAKNSGDFPGWAARYVKEQSFISRYCSVKGKWGYIITCLSPLPLQSRNRTEFSAVIGSLRHLTSAEQDSINEQHLIVYSVKDGDTLESVAKQYGVKAAALKDYNALDSSELSPGQKLKIPS